MKHDFRIIHWGGEHHRHECNRCGTQIIEYLERAIRNGYSNKRYEYALNSECPGAKIIMQRMKNQRPPKDVPLRIRCFAVDGGIEFLDAIYTSGPGGVHWFEKLPGHSAIIPRNVTHWAITE